jgi:hypothetical protein
LLTLYYIFIIIRPATETVAFATGEASMLPLVAFFFCRSIMNLFYVDES